MVSLGARPEIRKTRNEVGRRSPGRMRMLSRQVGLPALRRQDDRGSTAFLRHSEGVCPNLALNSRENWA